MFCFLTPCFVHKNTRENVVLEMGDGNHVEGGGGEEEKKPLNKEQDEQDAQKKEHEGIFTR